MTFAADQAEQEPLLCDLHARVGVVDAQVPSWLGWTEPLTKTAPRLMSRRTLLAGLGTLVVLVAIGLGVLHAHGRRRRATTRARASARPPPPRPRRRPAI